MLAGSKRESRGSAPSHDGTVAVCCSVLQCVAVVVPHSIVEECCRVLQCVAVGSCDSDLSPPTHTCNHSTTLCYMHADIHTHTHTRTHTLTHILTHTHTYHMSIYHVYVYTDVYTNTDRYTHTHLHIPQHFIVCAHAPTNILSCQTHAHTQIYHKSICHIYVYVHIYTHTDTHTHTPSIFFLLTHTQGQSTRKS